MSLAQGLYENGYITYMRTDSAGAVAAGDHRGAHQAKNLYGADSVTEKPRVYVGKSKNAQEAHEAIRPSGDAFRMPGELKGTLRGNEWKLYDLIWKRTVASQMADAKGSTASVTIKALIHDRIEDSLPAALAAHRRRVRRHRHRDHVPRLHARRTRRATTRSANRSPSRPSPSCRR